MTPTTKSCNDASGAWKWKGKATRRQPVNYFCKHGMKQQTILKNLLPHIMSHDIKKSVVDKLKWDETALQLALKIDKDKVKGAFPSLYLNIAKCHEDLNDLDNAKKNYDLAHSFTNLLPDNGYGNMVKAGIMKGIERVTK